jgi:hypothetical protein
MFTTKDPIATTVWDVPDSSDIMRSSENFLLVTPNSPSTAFRLQPPCYYVLASSSFMSSSFRPNASSEIRMRQFLH